MRVKAFAAFCLTLLLAALCSAPGDGAHAQGGRRRAPQRPAAAAPQQPERPKQVIIGRGADTARGSRMTITSDEALNDYSAYRSGDRFYVELPNANAATAARAAGKGFSDLQVQRRGKNVVLSYRVAPGAKPRVEQRFNRLEVVFEVPEGEGARPAQPEPGEAAPTPAQPQRAAQNQTPAQPAATRTPAAAPTPAGAAPQTTATPPLVNPSAVAEPVPAAQSPAVAEQTAATPEQTAPPAEQPPAQELAQAQPPAPAAPAADNPSSAQGGTGTSVGAFLLRNWTVVLIAALLLTGIGLLIAGRRSTAASDAPADSPAPKLAEARTPTAEASSAATVASVATVAPAAAPVVAAAAAAKESKKGSKKSKKAAARARRAEEKGKAAETVDAGVASEASATSALVAEEVAAEEVVTVEAEAPAAVETPDVVEAPAEVEPEPEQTAEVVPYVAEAAPVEAEPATAAVEETAAPVEEMGIAPAEESAAEVAPVAAAFDPDRAQEETRVLLEGGAYDRAMLSTRDAMARQLIAAELLAALAGRNAERHERARVAFREFGYFEEKVEDLRAAGASAERASAARALGLYGDTAATPHLVAALEDESVEVRRAAVETLASLRDPAAVGPLEELLRREKSSREKVNRKLVEHALEACREGAGQTVAAAEPAAPAEVPAPPAEVSEAIETAEATSLAPFVEPSVEAVEESPAAVVAEETAAIEPVREEESAPFVSDEHAPFVEEASQPAVEAEPAPFAYAPAVEDESAAVEQSTEFSRDEVETPSVESPSFATSEVETRESASPFFAAPAAEVEEKAVSQYVAAPEAVEGATEPPAAEREPAPFVAEAGAPAETGLAPADEWVEFDMSELGATQPAPAEPLFETSAGEAVAPPAPSLFTRPDEAPAPEAFEFAPDATAIEPATTAVEPVAEAAATPVADEAAIEPVEAASRAGRLADEPRPQARLFDAPAAEETTEPRASATDEKGVALFDEFSAVPANIQQRLASREPSERAAAVSELARVDAGEAFHQVCAAFDDESRDVRSAAARALFEMEGDRADSFTRALREATPERRRNIGAAIASSGLASDAISQLTGESREKTYEAFSLLFLMAKAGEVAPLVRAIEGHPESEVRLAVVKLLALSGQKEILPAFRRLAVRGSLPTEVRSAVMEAIYQISSQTEPTPAA